MLDGVLDTTVFSTEMLTLATTSLIHTEVGIDAFGEACEAAGPKKLHWLVTHRNLQSLVTSPM